MELKLIADVGLVGLPNAGKSTLLSVISNARPEIGDYAFTTLTPNLGVVPIDQQTSVLFADIPGLIEGAAEGKGLGDEFLRHVERTLVLVHVIDAYQDDIAVAYQTIQDELKAYRVDLTTRPQVIALNKVEGLSDDIVDDLIAQIKTVAPEGTPVCAISAQAHKGAKELLYKVKDILEEEKRKLLAIEDEESAETEALPTLTLAPTEKTWTVEKSGDEYIVRGARIERFAIRTDMNDQHGMARLRDIMKKLGIMHELVRQGVKAGDRVLIADKGEFTY